MRNYLSISLAGLLLMLSLGCALLDMQTATPEGPPTQTSTPNPPEPTWTPLPPSPTPEPTINPCPAMQDVTPPARTTDVSADIQAIRSYLSQGGASTQITLKEQESLHQGDVTGDGVPEIVYVLIDPEAEQIPPKGLLVVFTCRQGDVDILYQYEPGEWFGLNWISIEDLTQDGVADLVFSEVSCGAHTCWHTPRVWSWQGGDFVDRMGTEYSFPYPGFKVTDAKLVIVAGGIGSVGAGPQRPVTTTLMWTGQVITATETTTAPPSYRYHAFLDGDRALASAHDEEAMGFYRQVIDDDTLEPWGAFSSEEEERQWLTALAYWRLMTLRTRLGREDAADQDYAALTEIAAPGETGYPVVVMAERFRRAYQRDQDPDNACAYAVGSDEAFAILDFLNTFGYANPVYELPDLCLDPSL
ncbi:MAG: bacterial transcriptional activator domain-containing protein [Anaerolineae bacterium]